MPNPPLHNDPLPFITLPNWVKAATVCGFNIQPIFDRLGVQTDLIHLEDATIRQPQLDAVMSACVAASRQHHFPFMLGETFAFDYLPDIATFLSTSPTLRDAARVFDWVRQLINPMIDVRIDEQGETAQLILQAPGDAPPNIVAVYFIEALFASIVRFGRMLNAEVERYGRLDFRYPAPVHAAAYEHYFRMPVLFSQRANALQLPRSYLDRPLEGGFPALHGQAEVRVEQRLARLNRSSGLVAAVEAVFEAEPGLLGQGIERLAQRLEMNPRTLQRHLLRQDEQFAQLQARVRYRMALNYLEQAELDLETISERLGFSDRRSFTRAFTRWSGVSPSRYRGRR